MSSICVYTCVAGGYEKRLYPPVRQSRATSFVCFTDTPLQGTRGWQIRPPASPPEIQRPDLVNRYHKFFAHRLFPDAQHSIYLDANLHVIGDLAPLVAQLDEAAAGFGAARHAGRSSYLQEIERCLATQKFKGDDAVRAAAQRDAYLAEGLPGGVLAVGSMLLRRHACPQLDAAMALWWEQVTTYTARDQISLPYVLWKSQLPWLAFDFDVARPNHYTVPYRHGRTGYPLKSLSPWLRAAFKRPQPAPARP